MNYIQHFTKNEKTSLHISSANVQSLSCGQTYMRWNI